MQSVPLHVIHLDQDDPKKCTSRKLHQSGLINLHESANSAPRRGYLLDPRAKTVLAPEDGGLISLGGSIVVLDCSWKHIEESLDLTVEPDLKGGFYRCCLLRIQFLGARWGGSLLQRLLEPH